MLEGGGWDDGSGGWWLHRLSMLEGGGWDDGGGGGSCRCQRWGWDDGHHGCLMRVVVVASWTVVVIVI